MITELTPAQERRLVELREEWITLGHATEPGDEKAAEEAMAYFYRTIGQPIPFFFWSDSPLGNVIFPTVLNRERNLGRNLEQYLWRSLRQHLGRNLEQRLERNLEQRLEQRLERNLEQRLEHHLERNLWQNLERNLWQNLWQNLGRNLRRSLWQNLRRNLGQNLDQHWHWGAHEASWIVFYSFAQEIGVPYSNRDSEILSYHAQYARNALWANSFEGICFMSRRPTVCKTIWRESDETYILHCDGGPAYAFADGYALWMLNGVAVSQDLAETPVDKLDATCFAQEPNVEIRREILRKIGMERILQVTEARKLDEQTITFPDNRPGLSPRSTYMLYEVPLGGETGEWPYLKMWNPSEECWHFEAVPKDCRTVLAALDFRNKGKFEHLAPLS
jgi:hypothetical protein